MKDPVDHILRPQLPWRRRPGITECGLDASKVSAIDRDAFAARMKDYGQRRCSMMTCITCSDTSRRWKGWEQDPREAVGREVEWEARHWRSQERGDQLRFELLAIAELIDAHRDEFDAAIDRLRRQKEWAEKKAELAKRANPPPPGRGLL